MVAHHRATETALADALFRDPLAAVLAGERGKAIAQAAPASAMSAWVLATRTVIIDEIVIAAVRGGVDAVVNLGAGLDARPQRLDLPPDLLWVEIDFPDVIAYKTERIGTIPARCRLERIALDLNDRESRTSVLASLDARARRLLVITEGVVPYLDEPQVADLARALHGLAHVEGWIVDYVSPQAHEYRRRAGLDRHMHNAPFKFQPADWFAFFAGQGWRARDVRYLADAARAHHRPPPFPRRIRLLMSLLRRLFGDRGDQFRKSMGYVVLEPQR